MTASFSPEAYPDVRGIASPLGSLPGATRLGKVRLAVSNLQASLPFYRDVVGLRLLGSAVRTADGKALARLGTATGTVLLELEEMNAAMPTGRRTRRGLYHTALLLPSRADLGSFVLHLERLRFPYGSSDHLVSEAVYLVDPDGLSLEVYADRPRAEWEYRDGLLVSGVFPLNQADVKQAAASAWTGIPDGTTMGHVHFYVADLARSSRFYHEAMGLNIAMSIPGALFVSAGGYHHHVGYNVFAAGSPPATDQDPRVLFWELVLPDTETVSSVAARLSAVAREDRIADVHAPSFVDPDGVRVVLRTRTDSTVSLADKPRYGKRMPFKMMPVCFAAAMMFLPVVSGQPAWSQETLPVPEVGRMVDIPGAHETPDPAIDYKVVFDLNSTSDKIEEVNPGLTTVAAFVNTFSHWKVEKNHRHFVVIFHGATVDLVVNDAAYRQRHDGHTNPNVKIMRELSDAGVLLVVCGQSALQHNVDLKTLQPEVQLNYSATVTLMNLGMQGYVRIEE